MEFLFVNILNTAIVASVMIIGVILARLALQRTPKFMICLLWGVVALRLILPFSIGDLLPAGGRIITAEAETQPPLSVISPTQTVIADEPVTDVAPTAQENDAPSVIPGTPAENGGSSVTVDGGERPTEGQTTIKNEEIIKPTPEKIPEAIVEGNEETVKSSGLPAHTVGYATVIWVIGMACMALYAVIGYVRLYLRTRVSFEREKGVRICDGISSSFIMGVFRPRIMIPSDMSSEEEKYVLMHERSHLKRLDHVWKLIAYALLAVYWFDPLVWIAFFLFSADIEYACDERVIRNGGEEIKVPYANALVNCASSSAMSFSGPIAFGEKSVVGRVKNVLHYKKPALWLAIACVVAAAALTVFALLPPVSGDGALIRVDTTDSTASTEHNPVDKNSTEPADNTEPTAGTEHSVNTEPGDPTENTEPTENPEPTEPDPTEPEPTEPEPTEPEPTEPEPTEPEPTEPEPTEPEPTEPNNPINFVARDTMMSCDKIDLSVATFHTSYQLLVLDDTYFCEVPIKYDKGEVYVLELQSVTISSVEELQRNLTKVMSVDLGSNPDFSKYNDEYFEESSLIVIIDVHGTSWYHHEIFDIALGKDELCIGIKKCFLGKTPGDFKSWISIIEVPKELLKKVKTLSFYGESLNY